MPEIEKVALASTSHPASKPAVGAIFTGVFVVILSYAAAIAQAMTSAPSHLGAGVAIAVMILGCALALSGLASIWLPRLRKPARISNYVALALLALAFVADKAMIAFE